MKQLSLLPSIKKYYWFITFYLGLILLFGIFISLVDTGDWQDFTLFEYILSSLLTPLPLCYCGYILGLKWCTSNIKVFLHSIPTISFLIPVFLLVYSFQMLHSSPYGFLVYLDFQFISVFCISLFFFFFWIGTVHEYKKEFIIYKIFNYAAHFLLFIIISLIVVLLIRNYHDFGYTNITDLQHSSTSRINEYYLASPKGNEDLTFNEKLSIIVKNTSENNVSAQKVLNKSLKDIIANSKGINFVDEFEYKNNLFLIGDISTSESDDSYRVIIRFYITDTGLKYVYMLPLCSDCTPSLDRFGPIKLKTFSDKFYIMFRWNQFGGGSLDEYGPGRQFMTTVRMMNNPNEEKDIPISKTVTTSFIKEKNFTLPSFLINQIFTKMYDQDY